MYVIQIESWFILSKVRSLDIPADASSYMKFHNYEILTVNSTLVVLSWLLTEIVEKPMQKWLQRVLCVSGSEQAALDTNRHNVPRTSCCECWEERCESTCDDHYVPPTEGHPGFRSVFVTLYFWLMCPMCIPGKQSACFNPFNVCAGCGNCCSDCRPPRSQQQRTMV